MIATFNIIIQSIYHKLYLLYFEVLFLYLSFPQLNILNSLCLNEINGRNEIGSSKYY